MNAREDFLYGPIYDASLPVAVVPDSILYPLLIPTLSKAFGVTVIQRMAKDITYSYSCHLNMVPVVIEG